MAEQLSTSLAIPIISDEAKHEAIKSVLDAASTTAEKHLPGVVLSFLKGPPPSLSITQEINNLFSFFFTESRTLNDSQFKERLVEAATEEVEAAPMINKHQKVSIVKFVVDKLYSLLIANTAVEDVLLNPTTDQQEKRLQILEKQVQREIFMAECDARRKQRMLNRKLEKVQARQSQLAMDSSKES